MYQCGPGLSTAISSTAISSTVTAISSNPVSFFDLC